MRLGLVVILCLLNVGCAILRRDREEPVENGPRERKAEPVLKPSDVLKPRSLELASPVSDSFYVRGTYFQPAVTTEFGLGSSGSQTQNGDVVSGEDNLGLDDVVNQGRMEFDFRLGERNHVRIDYFKLNRFGEVPLNEATSVGDFTGAPGERFRTVFDWRVFSLTYTYSLFKGEAFEAGLGIGMHVVEGKMDISIPGTTDRATVSEVAPFGTIAVNAAYRISKRWAVTGRAQTYTLDRDDYNGTLSDYHADIQYRWRKNFAVGIGYSMLSYELEVIDTLQPVYFNLEASGPELFFRASF